MPFRPILLPLQRRFRALAPATRCFSSSSAAGAAEEEAHVVRETIIPRNFGFGSPGVGGGVRGSGKGGIFRENPAVSARFGPEKAWVAARFEVCVTLAREGRWREMRSALAQMACEQGSGSAPFVCNILWSNFTELDSGSVIWDALANIYARFQMIHDALYVLSKMDSLNMQISVSTYDSVLYSLRNTEMAVELFEEMKARGVCHSEYSHGIVIDGLCKQEKVREALSFFQEVLWVTL